MAQYSIGLPPGTEFDSCHLAMLRDLRDRIANGTLNAPVPPISQPNGWPEPVSGTSLVRKL